MDRMDPAENRQRKQDGRLHYAFKPELMEERLRCLNAVRRLNTAANASRRQMVEMWRDIIDDKSPLPPPAPTEAEDAALLWAEPYIDPPIRIDYGYNVILAPGVYVNSNATFIDSVPIRIGARTLMGPNCSFYAGKHPTDPKLRDGLNGPEDGKEINVGEDCWLGGSVVVVPGVTIGQGCTIGAGSVVTKDIPPFSVAVGNPARVIRKVDDAEKSGRAHLEKTGSLP